MRALFSLIRRWILRALGGLCALRVKFLSFALRAAALLPVALFVTNCAPTPQDAAPRFYLGFDRNIYPGDASLPILRKTFAFSSYWLSPPPGERTNTWSGKRALLRSQGFGFLVLYRGPESRQLEKLKDPRQKGEDDSISAADAAEQEGFPPMTIVFLDIEEGGRLSPAYHDYIHGWLWYLRSSHGRNYQGGFYCSGIPVKEGKGKTITTCEDISNHLFHSSRAFALWAYNDVCPPSPGCSFPENPPSPAIGDRSFCDSCIDVWQFAQSPRRKEFTARCPAKYAPDGNCYAPGDSTHKWFLDVNSATSPDPSGGPR
jgi:glycoside hydrolase-like protein